MPSNWLALMIHWQISVMIPLMLCKLNTRHPTLIHTSRPPPAASIPDDFEISEKDIVGAIRSFPCGSARGPDKLGGLGVRSAVEVAPSAFLASAHFSSELVNAILPPSVGSFSSPLVVEAQSYGSARHDHQAPEGAAACKQKAWDGLRAASAAERMQRVQRMMRNVPVFSQCPPTSRVPG